MIDDNRIIYEFLAASVASPVSTTLNGSLTATALSIPVTSGAGFAALDPPLLLKVDSELIIGTVLANTVTAEGNSSANLRGAMGSTAATHLTGATISVANLYSILGTAGLGASAAVYPEKLPAGYDNTTPAIVWNIRGGSAEIKIPMHKVNVEFFCYGGTRNYIDAHCLYRALYDRLQNVTNENTASGTVKGANEDVIGQDATESDTEWPRVFTAFQIMLMSR